MKITHADIAAEAGVSVATVDRVLNARPGVAPRTEARIHEAVRRLETVGVGRRRDERSAQLGLDVILPAGPNTFMGLLEAALAEEGARRAPEGVRVRCHRVEGFDPAMLAACIRELGRTGSGLAVVALENPVVREAVHEVAERGIPVVTLVSNLNTPRKVGYVGLDNRAAGRSAGYLMHRFVRGETGKVVMLEGSLGLSYRDHQERELGFRDALREYAPGLRIVGRWETQDDFEQAHRRTREILDQHPDVLGVYSIGSGVRGIAHGLVERAREDVVFVAHDLTPHTRQFLIEGVVDAVIDQSPRELARRAIATLEGAFSPVPPAPPDPLPVTIYFRENLP